MRLAWVRTFCILAVMAWGATVWAAGVEFSGGCTTLSWSANTEPDLAGYEILDRTSLTVTAQVVKTTGTQSSIPCSQMGFNPGQHYLSIRAFDSSGNRSDETAEIPFVIIIDNMVNDLAVITVTATTMTLAFTEVNDGAGSPAHYDVRFATPFISWGLAESVSQGTCSTVLFGVSIGASKSCTVTGLTTTTPYQFQLVPFRGTFGVDAVYGPVSNIASATTGGTPPVNTRTTIIVDDFNRTNGPLIAPWVSGYTGQQIPAITSNTVRPPTSGGAQSIAAYNATMPNDQWSQVMISTIQGAGTVSAFAKLRYTDPPTNSGYECRANRNNATERSEIAKRENGASITLTIENTTTWASGDTLDCQVQGNTITLTRISGGVSTVLLTVDDTTFSSGKVGLAIAAATLGDGVLDNFSAGGFVTAVTTDPCGC